MTSVGFSKFEMVSDVIPWPHWHPGLQLPFWILWHLCVCSSVHVLLLLPCLVLHSLPSSNWWNLRGVVSALWCFFRSLPWTKTHLGSQSSGCSQTDSLVSHLSHQVLVCPHHGAQLVSTSLGASLAANPGRMMVLGKVGEAVSPLSTSSFGLCKQWKKTKHSQTQSCKAEFSHWCAR